MKKKDMSEVLDMLLMSGNRVDSNFQRANVVDALFAIADAIHRHAKCDEAYLELEKGFFELEKERARLENEARRAEWRLQEEEMLQ